MASGKIVAGAVVFELTRDEDGETEKETPYIDVTVRLLRKDMKVTLGANVEIKEIRR